MSTTVPGGEELSLKIPGPYLGALPDFGMGVVRNIGNELKVSQQDWMDRNLIDSITQNSKGEDFWLR